MTQFFIMVDCNEEELEGKMKKKKKKWTMFWLKRETRSTMADINAKSMFIFTCMHNSSAHKKCNIHLTLNMIVAQLFFFCFFFFFHFIFIRFHPIWKIARKIIIHLSLRSELNPWRFACYSFVFLFYILYFYHKKKVNKTIWKTTTFLHVGYLIGLIEIIAHNAIVP